MYKQGMTIILHRLEYPPETYRGDVSDDTVASNTVEPEMNEESVEDSRDEDTRQLDESPLHATLERAMMMSDE